MMIDRISRTGPFHPMSIFNGRDIVCHGYTNINNNISSGTVAGWRRLLVQQTVVACWSAKGRGLRPGGSAFPPRNRLHSSGFGHRHSGNQRERIFRVFEQMQGGRYGGTGIGLSMVWKGIERKGGHVGLESAPVQGTRFWIELQKARSAVAGLCLMWVHSP